MVGFSLLFAGVRYEREDLEDLRRRERRLDASIGGSFFSLTIFATRSFNVGPYRTLRTLLARRRRVWPGALGSRRSHVAQVCLFPDYGPVQFA